jgi:hypothetical protein
MSERAAGVPASYPLRAAQIWTVSDLCWGVIFLAPVLAAYLVSLPQGIGWWDSGELFACAKTLSVAHRPGFPLYVLCGRLAYGWAADGRWLANATSTLATAAGLLCFWRGLCLLAGNGRFTRLWVAFGGWLLAFSPLVWRQAIRTEVYAPALACLGAAFLLAAASQRAPDPRTAARRYLAAIYLLVLSASLHSALAAAVGIGIVGLLVCGDFRPSLRQWGWACFASLVGLSVHLFVPLRAHLAAYVWGEPGSLGGFFAYLTASDAHGIIVQEAGGTLARAGELALIAVSRTHWLLTVLGGLGVLLGAVLGGRLGRQPMVLLAATLAVAATVVSFVIPDNADLWAYLIPMLWALWWGWSRLSPSHALAARVTAQGRPWAGAALLAVVAVVVLFSLRAGWQTVRVAKSDLADTWGKLLLTGTRAGDLVVIQDANTEFLLRGLAHSDPDWPAVTVLNTSLAEAPWYRQWWHSHNGTNTAGIAAQGWTRQLAAAWRADGGRVFVDFGAPGWLPTELVPEGWLGQWSELGGERAPPEEDVPRADSPAELGDPDWVRTMVWYYYRLGTYYRARGHASLAVEAWEEGLRWAPGEYALAAARAELASVVSQPTGS